MQRQPIQLKGKKRPLKRTSPFGIHSGEDNAINQGIVRTGVEMGSYVFDSKAYPVYFRQTFNAESLLYLLIRYTQLKESKDDKAIKECNQLRQEFYNLRIYILDNQMSGKMIGSTLDPETYKQYISGTKYALFLQGFLNADPKELKAQGLNYDIKALQDSITEDILTSLRMAYKITDPDFALKLTASIIELGIPNAVPIVNSDFSGWDKELKEMADILTKKYGGFITPEKRFSFDFILAAIEHHKTVNPETSRVKDWIITKGKQLTRAIKVGVDKAKRKPISRASTEPTLSTRKIDVIIRTASAESLSLSPLVLDTPTSVSPTEPVTPTTPITPKSPDAKKDKNRFNFSAKRKKEDDSTKENIKKTRGGPISGSDK